MLTQEQHYKPYTLVQLACIMQDIWLLSNLYDNIVVYQSLTKVRQDLADVISMREMLTMAIRSYSSIFKQ